VSFDFSKFGAATALALSLGLLVTSSSPLYAQTELVAASDDRLLTELDLHGLSAGMLRIARNEIFARHGYAFNSRELTAYFSQFAWYRPVTKNVSLNAVEQSNVAFIKRYEDSPSLQANLRVAAPAQPVITQQTTVVVADNPAQLAQAQTEIDELSAQVASLRALVEQQGAKAEDINGSSIHAMAEAELQKLLETLTKDLNDQEIEASAKYQTTIRPQVDHSQSSPRDLARHFPKIPWYDPQYADAVGEFSLESRVSDKGELLYDLKFLEPEYTTQNIASQFILPPSDAGVVLAALTKAYSWAETARANNVRDFFRKEVDCTPSEQCENRVPGNTSTQVDFLVLEQGATGVRLIRNKGAYKEEFGMSIESAALLASYFEFVLDLGQDSFEAGTRTTEEINSLFE